MIHLQLRPEVESQIVAEAQARGLDVAQYVEQMIVERHSVLNDSSGEERKRAVESMLAFSREHKLTLGDIELRDLVHDGHEY